jgi:outer membrane protein TolC
LTAIFLTARAYSEEKPALGLAKIIEETLKNNPQIQAAKSRFEAARARVALLRSLSDPKFEYEYDKITADMDAVMRGKTAPMRTFAISQELPFPTKLFSRKQAAAKEAEVYEEQYNEAKRKIIKEVKKTFFQLFFIGEKIAVADENLNLLTQFIAVANKKYEVGKANQEDVLRAQVEHSKLSNERVLLEQEQRIYKSMLNYFLNRPQNIQIEITDAKNNKDRIFEEATILNLAKENRPELKSYK